LGEFYVETDIFIFVFRSFQRRGELSGRDEFNDRRLSVKKAFTEG